MDKPAPQKSPHHVVIIGGGFGGLYAARTLSKAPVRVTLVDRRNFHLFQPLLYQVATGILGPGEITAPLRHILRKQKNAAVLLGEVVDFDPANRRVILADGVLDYDTLIVAAGMKNHYYGHDAWEKVAPGLKSIEDSAWIRQKIFFAFEVAEREPDPEKRRAWLTFVIVGSGPTGVELTGMVAEIARETLKEDFRSINPEESEILLVDAADRVLPAFAPELSEHARSTLHDLGVQVRTGVRVTDIDEQGIALEGAAGTERIAAHTVLWAAGVAASPLGRMLAGKTGAQSDRLGRVMVNPDLSMPGHPEIFVIGDMAHLPGKDGNPLPGLAPVATQQGRYVARVHREAAQRGKAGGALFLLRQGNHGRHRKARRCCQHRQVSFRRDHGVAHVALHPPAAPDQLREPPGRARPLGLFVLHPQSRLKGADRDGHPAPAHHGRREDAGTMISRH